LAYQVFRSDATLFFSKDKISKKGPGILFRQGFIMNVLNPKVTLFFLAFFPGFLFSKELSTVIQFYVLGLLFMLVSGVIFSLIAILSGNISSYLKNNSKVGLYLKWLQIIVFLGIGLYLLLSDNKY
jgi:threonine/homoserine/homoserine lactone efflux protein